MQLNDNSAVTNENETVDNSKFAEIAEFASLQRASKSDNGEKINNLNQSPLISIEVYKSLPQLLKDGCNVLTDERTKDVFLTGSLGVLSGCLPNVYGFYRGDKVYSNLFGLVIAPPASGKGVLKYSKKLAEKYHRTVFAESVKKKEDYQKELAEYEKKLNSGSTTNIQKPTPSNIRVPIIPGNCSNSRLLEHLQNNGGEGIICETEADIVSQANKQEWGNYSPLLRAAFHHESYSMSRKTGDEFIEITEPRISTVLTGTPSQLSNLVNSVEDGLFSRFLYYSFHIDPVWQSPSPQNTSVKYHQHYEVLSEKVYEMVKFLEKYPTEIKLAQIQWDLLDETFEKLLSEAVYYGENASSIAFRHGLMLFRICMIFTAMRKYENRDTSTECVCSDEDFLSALSLIETYFQHSTTIYNSLGKDIKQPYSKGKMAFINALPNEFTRGEAVLIGKEKLKMGVRSIDDILKDEEVFDKVSYGNYKKIAA